MKFFRLVDSRTMITSREDLEFYIRQDSLINVGIENVGPFKVFRKCVLGWENYRVPRYLRILRKFEYAINCPHGLFQRIRFHWLRILERQRTCTRERSVERSIFLAARWFKSTGPDVKSGVLKEYINWS